MESHSRGVLQASPAQNELAAARVGSSAELVELPALWSVPVLGALFRPHYSDLIQRSQELVSFDRIFKVCGVEPNFNLSSPLSPLKLQDLKEAETLLARALPLQEGELDEQHPDVMRTLRALSRLNIALSDEKRATAFIELAKSRAQEGSVIYCEVIGDLSKLHLTFGRAHAGYYTYQGQALNEEVPYFKSGIEVNRERARYLGTLFKAGLEVNVQIGDCLQDLADMCYGLRNYAAAERAFSMLLHHFEELGVADRSSEQSLIRMLRWSCESEYGAGHSRTKHYFRRGWGDETFHKMAYYFDRPPLKPEDEQITESLGKFLESI